MQCPQMMSKTTREEHFNMSACLSNSHIDTKCRVVNHAVQQSLTTINTAISDKLSLIDKQGICARWAGEEVAIA